MKKIFLLFLCSLLCFSLFACGNSNDSTEDKGDYIYLSDTALQIVYNGDYTSHDGVKRVYNDLRNILSVSPWVVTDAKDLSEHEIVIGETNRPISKEAYRRLNLLEKEDSSFCGYVIYSNGTSVAIAYDVDSFDMKIAELCVINYFADNYIKSDKLTLNKGVVKSDVIDIFAYQETEDEVMLLEKWSDAEAEIAKSVGGELAAEIIFAMRNCYDLFSDDVISWFANLYDPIAGAYYYSNSGRDTVGYGPDLESTYQALSFISGTGMAEGINKAQGDDVIPEWMREQILKFAMELQDPVSGYFYHPQWGGDNFDDRRQLIDSGYTSRRGRDLQWALSLIQRFGGEPTYDIPTMGIKGSGILYDGTRVSEVALTSKLGRSAASAVSLAVPTSSAVPTHLQSVENLKAYLNKLDVNGDSYYVGNLLESQSKQIVARDSVLDPSGRTTPLADAVKEFFDSHQNTGNGSWTLGDKIDYESVNGILKISGVYNGIKKEFPNPINAIKTAMAGITMKEAPTTVCYVLNPWYAITMLIQNVENYNSSPNKLEVEKDIAQIRTEILLNAVELINVTRDKTSAFMKNDGSFSYFPKTSGPNSQGVPVAVSETEEGDVNATYMFISGIPNHIWGILGCDMVPVYTKSDRMRYWDILNSLGAIVKDEVIELEAETYEDEDVNDIPMGVTTDVGNKSFAGIKQTTAKNGQPTKALALTTVSGSTDIMRLTLTNYMPFFNAVIFEADIKIESASGGGQFELLPYGSPGDAYRIILDYSKDGNVTARTANDFKQTTLGKEGSWIHIKLEYSFADIDYDRNGTKDLQVKLYADNKLVAEGRIPPGSEAINHGSVSGVRFFSWTASDATLYVDNLLFRQDKVTLDPPPTVNDEDESEKITFEQSTNDNIPGKVGISDVSGNGSVTIENIGTSESPNKVLLLSSPLGSVDALKFYLTKTKDRFNAVAFEAVLKFASNNQSGEVELYLTGTYNSTAAKLILEYNGDDVTVKKVDANGTAEFAKTLCKTSESVKLRIEYSMDIEGVRLFVYANDKLLAEGTESYNGFHGAENISYMKLNVKDTSDVKLYIDDFSFVQTELLREGNDPYGEGITFENENLSDVEDKIELSLSDKAKAEIVEDIRCGRVTKSLRLVSPQNSLDSFIFKFGEANSEAENTIAFEADFKITDADGGNILTLYHKTESGEIANKMVFGWSTSSGNIFVLNMYNSYGTVAKDFDTVVVGEGIGTYFKMRVEYTKISDTLVRIGFYINGEKIAAIDTAHAYESPAIDASLITDVVLETYQSRKTTLYIDNLVIERTSVNVGTVTPDPEAPPTPVLPSPSEPGKEYGGSIYDDDENGHYSGGNWS